MEKAPKPTEQELRNAFICRLKADAEMPPKRIAELMGITEPEVERLIQLARSLRIEPKRDTGG